MPQLKDVNWMGLYTSFTGWADCVRTLFKKPDGWTDEMFEKEKLRLCRSFAKNLRDTADFFDKIGNQIT